MRMNQTEYITCTLERSHFTSITDASHAGCGYPPVPEGTVLYSNIGQTVNGTLATPDTDNDNSSTEVFPHKAVLSFGCLAGYRANATLPVGKPFHTLDCNKREWRGNMPVCNGEFH